MKLYYTPGACSLAPHIILRELDLPFELEAVDLATKRTSTDKDFFAVNPKGYVPALLLDDGEVLTEGTAIIQFLADRYQPGKFAPELGTVDRARMNEQLNFIASELHKGFGPLFNPALVGDARDAAVAAVGRKIDIVEQDLGDGRPYLGGEQFSVADAYLFTVLSWGPMLGLDLSAWPKAAAHRDRVGARPAVQSATAAEQTPAAEHAT